MKRIALLLTALLSLLPFWAKDNYRYRNITMDDGLSSNAVRNIVQDRYGYIWFGTDNGLCRYDGTRVQAYKIAGLGINQYVSALMDTEQGLFVGTEHGVYCFSYEQALFERLPLDIHSTVTRFALDKDNCLWASTMGDGVWCYALKTGQMSHYDVEGGAVAQVFVDNSNQLWTVTNWNVHPVCRLNRLHDKFEPVNLSFNDYYGSLSMIQTRDGRLWLGTWEKGLLLMHSDGRLEQVLSPEVALHIHTLFEMQSEGDNVICIGSDNGAICYSTLSTPSSPSSPSSLSSPKTGQWHRLLESPGHDARFVYAIATDREGGLWVGTYYGGVVYMPPTGKRFEGLSAESGLSGNVIARFCEDSKGRVWIASDDGGLMCYTPHSTSPTSHLSPLTSTSYAHQDLLSGLNVHALALKGDDLWIGTYTTGVYVLSLATGQLRHYIGNGTDGSLDGFSSYAICHDRHGRTWVATNSGVNLYDDATGHFNNVGDVGALAIDIDEDSDGRLWLSTQGAGLWCYDPEHSTLRQHRHEEQDTTSLPDNQVNCLHIDKGGRLWIGTANGLCYKDHNANTFVPIPLDLPSSNIMGIVEDQGALWLSTERGIVRFQPNITATRFTLHDGLMSEQFQPNAAMKASDGRIYFGSNNGLNFFYPYQIKANSVMPPVYITSLTFPNAQTTNPLNAQTTNPLNDHLELDYHDARMLTFSFAALSYCSPQKNQYAYMMEGFDRDWNHVGNQHTATYTNLPAGEYTFRVRATNNDGVWSDNEAQLILRVMPPFWWSWWAKLLYILLVGAVIWYYIHYRLQRANQQHQQAIQRLAEQKENEVREARLNFFTMIAHEIRTPVSLIIAPLEQIKKELSRATDDERKAAANSSLITLHSSLQIIDRNAHRLLELVNQLLDFRKVESQTLEMTFTPQNVRQLLMAVCERFAPTFEQGGKQFAVNYPDEHFTAILDREAITKVVSNLLTNANKYTKTRVELSCIVDPDDEHFSIRVTDDGVGIRKEDRQRIFEPFFQAQDNKPGTGIGLNIVKNIVDQHHGTIAVESEVGKGTAFTVMLPVSQPQQSQQSQQSQGSQGSQQSQSSQGSQESQPSQGSQLSQQSQQSQRPQPSPLTTMLIVDDNEDMVSFLSSNFHGKYEVITAGDGIEALDLLNKHEVSIIISDWMMPRMDGAEFCRQVRRNPLTSHIPFVMLTAKTDDDSKVEGMDVGADIYIEKPFSVQYLEACIRNMLQMRRHLIEKFSTQPLEPVTEIASNPTDNQFLVKMNKVIEENFSNPDLNVNFLADKLNISRSGLFAKIKTLAEVTPNEMIQIVRLKRAAQLLKENNHSVSEIGYMVGFSNPSYFSKCFYKQFGIRPTDYMKQNRV